MASGSGNAWRGILWRTEVNPWHLQKASILEHFPSCEDDPDIPKGHTIPVSGLLNDIIQSFYLPAPLAWRLGAEFTHFQRHAQSPPGRIVDTEKLSKDALGVVQSATVYQRLMEDLVILTQLALESNCFLRDLMTQREGGIDVTEMVDERLRFVLNKTQLMLPAVRTYKERANAQISASVFAMPFFEFSGTPEQLIVRPGFWLYWAFSISVTIIAMVAWQISLHGRQSQLDHRVTSCWRPNFRGLYGWLSRMREMFARSTTRPDIEKAE
ncbi:hypothetical protein DL764_006195 [Monosporascus ibericus]|uniref:Uncharacterized protein n=1 Tax=Monosporascus ibericus TaxID=155417 RepID=A0A4Q4T9D2_9PEZI|nr:hypothetical protein DL764_006195 [Monosporascus ibericus]